MKTPSRLAGAGGIGFEQEELECAREYFDASSFSDALNWLEALVSSVSLVCAIEESISRISDLAMAVKKFAYDEQSPVKDLDVHDSLQSTITILGHKLRMKQIAVEKKFEASPSVIQTRGSALSQVWTNLIDNAADASPAQGRLRLPRGLNRNRRLAGCVSITDHGPGIPDDVLPRIFEAFFTTKPQGSGTGLGLEIVHRIVTAEVWRQNRCRVEGRKHPIRGATSSRRQIPARPPSSRIKNPLRYFKPSAFEHNSGQSIASPSL